MSDVPLILALPTKRAPRNLVLRLRLSKSGDWERVIAACQNARFAAL